MKAFKARMDIQHQESASAQSKLDQKGQEFLKLTRSYNKLLKQKNHRSREISKESLETSVLLNNLKKKLEEFEAKLREWDEEKTIFQNHLMCLEAQQKLLSEKCNSFQKRTRSYQFQISNKEQNQEEIVKYGQPEREKDGLIVEKLTAAVNEMTISRNRLEEENLKQLKMFQSQCQSSPETSFPATTQKFLQEEEKPTKEFEECLNSHLEEL
ncbi:deuterosome assembly protein 1 isoform X2 [Centrocercus urophasianus]|nr:deuterosome assembly protein 1 isoform X2 [Centrocercus urophasianus]XP_042694750.1 deuterosome assembly protein 1 isoform X2 [Centrocercus urophasianus]